MPYDAFFERVFGVSLNQTLGWERNHFDRAVHFAYGLLLTYPMREVFLRLVDVRGFWGYFLPLDLTMSTSMIYELIEWGAAVAFGGDLGQAYLGTQGDEWDAHKDMALAVVGACIAMACTLGVNLAFQRDFNAEWVESLRVKHPEPLGETRWRRCSKTPTTPDPRHASFEAIQANGPNGPNEPNGDRRYSSAERVSGRVGCASVRQRMTSAISVSRSISPGLSGRSII